MVRISIFAGKRQIAFWRIGVHPSGSTSSRPPEQGSA